MKLFVGVSVCLVGLVVVACSEGDDAALIATPAEAPAAASGVDASVAVGPIVTCTPPEQIAGDCQRIVCHADGTTQSLADDTDVPSAAECATFTCVDGAKVSTSKATGAACATGICDGAGTCVQGVGGTCTKASECGSGNCVDGVCCNESCTGECKSCNVAGAKGLCSNIPYYEEDTSFVPAGGGEARTCNLTIAGSLCSGQGACLRIVMTPCIADGQCVSGKCTNLKCLGAKGEICNNAGECLSGMCAIGTCK